MTVTLRVKIWPNGSPEPTEWMLTHTDETPPPGVAPGIYYSRSAGAGLDPLRVDDYQVSAAWGTLLGRDTFTRPDASTWGEAEVGGTWTATGGLPGKVSVAGGEGVLAVNGGNGGDMLLASVMAPSSQASLTYTVGPGPEVGATTAGLLFRMQGTTGYRAVAWHRAQGDVWALIQRNGAAVAQKVAALPTWAAGQKFHIRAEAVDPDVFEPRVYIGETVIVRAYVSGEAVEPGL